MGWRVRRHASCSRKCPRLVSGTKWGGDVRVVYSPLDAGKLAEENPDKLVVFLAIGFETTGPARTPCRCTSPSSVGSRTIRYWSAQKSGWRLSDRYRDFDAEYRFDVGAIDAPESALCRSGEVLQGLIKPHQCEAFGNECTPRRALRATMVSSEGACAVYFQHRRLDEPVARSPKFGYGLAEPLDVEGWTCPLPLRGHDRVMIVHGGRRCRHRNVHRPTPRAWSWLEPPSAPAESLTSP